MISLLQRSVNLFAPAGGATRSAPTAWRRMETGPRVGRSGVSATPARMPGGAEPPPIASHANPTPPGPDRVVLCAREKGNTCSATACVA